jgi:heat-inducible transcriptional repressor
MANTMSTGQLSERDREVLNDVVRTFILTGEPVSSRSVAKHEQHGVSAATIRNTMADLEDDGYLSQPHTSAGRIPTSSGYHLYIESLRPDLGLPSGQEEYIHDNIRGAVNSGRELVNVAGELLSELSHQVGVVLTPSMGETRLRQVELIPISGARVLCILVSTGGVVDQKVVRAESSLNRDELVTISNYLTETFAGLTVREIRARLIHMMADERAQVDRILADAIHLAGQALETSGHKDLVVEGTLGLLDQPELGSVSQVRCLLDMFDEKARMVNLLSQIIEGKGVRVLIGDDSELTSELDFSLVATNYRVGDRPLGSLGVFGPSRMEYQRMIPLVTCLGDALSAALERAYETQGLEG